MIPRPLPLPNGEWTRYVDTGGHNPALLLGWGRQDQAFPSAHARVAAALIPEARLTMIDDCGHYPQREQPEAFAGAVEAFAR